MAAAWKRSISCGASCVLPALLVLGLSAECVWAAVVTDEKQQDNESVDGVTEKSWGQLAAFLGRMARRQREEEERGGATEPQEEAVSIPTRTEEVPVRSWSLLEHRFWEDWQLPFLLASLLLLALLVITIVVVCWLKRQWRRSEEESLKQWIFHPVVKPPLEEYDAVQPQGGEELVLAPGGASEKVEEKEEASPVHNDSGHRAHLGGCVLSSSSSPSDSPSPEPVRVKAKGLLERRGSNASLKIHLHASAPEPVCMPTPPRECTAEEYLLSAGNRLSRKQLRTCLGDTRGMQAEFWDIPLNHPERTAVAGSGTKNRYRTILPNEHSRVRLPERNGDPLSIYINANYIRGYEGEERAYIATQGPLPHTVLDFWRMVVCERASCVVMITRLREKGQAKCEPYLPEEGSATYYAPGSGPGAGSGADLCAITVTVDRVLPRDGYVRRDMTLQSIGGASHSLSHFWYTSWPDHKTPSSARSLVAMAAEVEGARQRVDGSSGPVVVHCSAGIGRTGCFIAVSLGMTQLLTDGNVDVLGIVCAMRYDRGGMVQTGEQYEFIHRALALFERSLPDHSAD